MRRYTFLPNETVVEHIKNYREYGDQRSLAILMENITPVVHKQAWNLHSYGFDSDDLISEGFIGAINALKKYDTENGAPFHAYAVNDIKYAMFQFVIKNYKIYNVATTKPRRKIFFRLTSWLNGRKLTSELAEQFAKEHEVTVDDVFGTHQAMNAEMQDHEALEESLSSEDMTPDEALESKQEKALQKKYLDIIYNSSLLNDREKNILRDRFCEEPKTYMELAEIHGVTFQRIQQIEKRIFQKLKEKFIEES